MTDQRKSQHPRRDEEGRRADWEVDQEHPSPRRAVDDEPTDQRSDDTGKRPHPRQQADVPPALAGRHNVRDHGEGHRKEAAGAHSLDGARGNQLEHVLRQPGEQRPDEKHDNRGLEKQPATVHVADLSKERRAHGRAEEIGRHDPRVVVEPTQLTYDGGKRRRDHRLVKRGKKQAGHEPAEDDENLSMRKRHAIELARPA